MRFLTLISILLCCCFSTLSAQSSIKRIEGSPYPISTPPDVLYLTSESSYTYSQKIALQTLQGIIAKTKPEILRDMYGDKALIINNGVKIDNTYYNSFQGLLTYFADRLTGYILCDAKQNSTNVAISLAGILNAVAISADIEQTAINAGLSLLQDVSGKDETWLFANYGSQFSTQIASYQNVSDDRGLYLADYSVFAGAIQFWSSTPTSTLANNIFNRMDKKSAIMGWGPGEDNTVAALSQKSLMIHASDFAPNLSTLTNIETGPIEQKDPDESYKVVPNVHTVCFVMSDGDNVQWLLGASDDGKTWANPLRSKLNLGWTISPALTELAPPMYKKYVDNALTSSDGRNYLIAAPSGRGYYNPGIFPNLSAECDLLNKYMKKGDLRIANVIDVDNSPRKLEPYLRQDNIDALFYYNYSDYSGLKGMISWYKDKPSIGGRFNLWLGTLGQATDKTPETLAVELNKASTNINSMAAYSLIPVIVWSRNVNDVLECIGKLGPNVRVVAPDEFVWLIRKNLKGLAIGTGNGLKGDYFSGSNFDSLKYSKTDRTIDFDWATGSPDQTIFGTDSFSVRWTGQIQPVYSEEYTFYLTADDAAKLTINGNVLIDNLNSTGLNTQSGTMTLVSGQKYDITVEYSEKDENASCHLEWESASQMRQTVPKLQLYSAIDRPASSTGVVTAYSDCDFTGFYGGLKVGDYKTSDLNNLGIYDNDIASIKIMNGFKAILYDNDDLTGDSIVITSDSTCLGNWVNKTSSLRIITDGLTNLEGKYFLQNAVSNLYMDIAGGYTNTDDGANIDQYSRYGNTNQQFQLTHLGNGTYKILAVHSKKAVDIVNGSKTDGANVQQWTYYGLPSQQFIIKKTGTDTYNFIAKHSGKILEAVSISTGSNIRQYNNTNQLRGQWKLVSVPELPNGAGNGLNAQYYNGKNFETLRRTSIDTTINFNWGGNAPNAYVGADNFSVRWSGYIQPRASGTYTFFINSDNGRRLWINDQLVIDQWISDYGIEYSGTISLTANQMYSIKVEYFEEIGGASCMLEWMSPLQPREIVPKSQLYTILSGLNDIEADNNIKIYPNPITNKQMNVQIYDSDSELENTLVIYDLVGKPVFTTKIYHSCNVDVKSVTSGAYILSIKNNRKSVNKRILID